MGFLARASEMVERSRLVVEWEETQCLLCGGGRWTPLVEAPDRLPGSAGLWFVVVQCQDCGLCFTNPRPNRRSIGQFYLPGYRPHQVAATSRVRKWWRHWPALWGQAGNYRKVLPLRGQGRLLDFGCGGGSYLLRMHQQGWQVTGLDSSTSVARRIRTELGLPALAGSLPHPQLQHAAFDVITMWQSLEHVHSPLDVLYAAHRLLAPGGKLIVAVPNIDSLPFRWFGHVWNGLDLPRHLTHFAPWTLRLLLHRAGFRAGRMHMIRRSSWLRSSARHACRQPHCSRWYRWLRGKTSSNLASWYSYLTRQSDCIMVSARKR